MSGSELAPPMQSEKCCSEIALAAETIHELGSQLLGTATHQSPLKELTGKLLSLMSQF